MPVLADVSPIFLLKCKLGFCLAEETGFEPARGQDDSHIVVIGLAWRR